MVLGQSGLSLQLSRAWYEQPEMSRTKPLSVEGCSLASLAPPHITHLFTQQGVGRKSFFPHQLQNNNSPTDQGGDSFLLLPNVLFVRSSPSSGEGRGVRVWQSHPSCLSDMLCSLFSSQSQGGHSREVLVRTCSCVGALLVHAGCCQALLMGIPQPPLHLSLKSSSLDPLLLSQSTRLCDRQTGWCCMTPAIPHSTASMHPLGTSLGKVLGCLG